MVDVSDAILRGVATALSEHGEGFAIGCSYGSILLPTEAQSTETALRLADQRMYAQRTVQSVPLLGAPRRLCGSGEQRTAQQGQQLTVFAGAEPAQHLVFDLHHESSGLLQPPAALRRDPDLPGSPVAGAAPALGQPPAFEVVDQLDHGAWIDSHVGAQLLLDGARAGAENIEQREEGWGQANRVQRLRSTRMGNPPEPEEELPRELGNLNRR